MFKTLRSMVLITLISLVTVFGIGCTTNEKAPPAPEGEVGSKSTKDNVNDENTSKTVNVIEKSDKETSSNVNDNVNIEGIKMFLDTVRKTMDWIDTWRGDMAIYVDDVLYAYPITDIQDEELFRRLGEYQLIEYGAEKLVIPLDDTRMTRVQQLLVESVSYIRSYGVSAIQYLYDASNEEEWYDGKSEFYSRFGDANIIYRNEIEEILKDIEKSYNIQR